MSACFNKLNHTGILSSCYFQRYHCSFIRKTMEISCTVDKHLHKPHWCVTKNPVSSSITSTPLQCKGSKPSRECHILHKHDLTQLHSLISVQTNTQALHFLNNYLPKPWCWKFQTNCLSIKMTTSGQLTRNKNEHKSKINKQNL